MARIAEDEALLHRDDREPHSAHLNDLVGTSRPDICPTCRGITLLGQRRALAECEAKRRLIVFAYQADANDDGERGCCHSGEQIQAGGCPYMRPDDNEGARLLALPYADHPDYRSEWKP